MMRLKAKRDVVDPYLLWVILNSHVAKTFIREIVGASTYPNIKWENYRRFGFDLPPLEEQQRIAARLRERLSIVAEARAALEAQLAAAESLPAAHLRAVFESDEAKCWPHQRIGEICERIDYGFTASADFNITSPKFLRITDIQDGRVDWESVPGCKIFEAEEKQNELLQGDIVFARTGATTGKSFLITNPPPAVFASYLIRLRLRENITPKFISYFFQSDAYWKQIKAGARGGAQPNFNSSMLAALAVSVPPIEIQSESAKRLDRELHHVRDLHEAIQNRLDDLANIPAALLREAFSSASN